MHKFSLPSICSPVEVSLTRLENQTAKIKLEVFLSLISLIILTIFLEDFL